MVHSYERDVCCHVLSFPPCDSGEDSSSSDLDSSASPVGLTEGGATAVGLSQGDSGAPSAFVCLAGQVASALAGSPDCGSDDEVELDPLF